MVIPLRKQAEDERHEEGPLRSGTAWDTAGISIADTRRTVRTLLARAGHHPDHRPSQDAQLVVSELVTNAIRHAPGPGALLLELSPDDAVLLITVRDGSPRTPDVHPQDGSRVGGHGLRLVTQLCEQVHTVPWASGKQVTAQLRLGTPAD
ncbi:ATP-binding protein [Streptomyces sp. NPDC015684]|uniref:ATP-binding protein n=1 Tax=Streptomyces sp. NPDC015684 TaxID=3364963 RepID=UPI00370301BC